MTRRIARLALLLLALVLGGCGGPGVYSATVVWNGAPVFNADHALRGDLILLGGETQLAPGAAVAGRVVQLRGGLTLAGTVEGDIFQVGGRLALAPTARVGGDIYLGSGEFQRAPEASVAGAVQQSAGGVQAPLFPGWTVLPTWTTRSPFDLVFGLVARALLVGGLAWAFVYLRAAPLYRVAHAIRRKPLLMGALGLLTLVVAPSLLILMGFTLILLPVTVLGIVWLDITFLYGWLALGIVSGAWLARRLGWRLPECSLAFVGTFLLTLLMSGVELLPVIGAVFPLLVASVGLGAVFLTRYGLRVYRPAD